MAMDALALELITALRERGLSLATAESCSGGLLAASFTDVPGASEVFGYGLVTYSNEAKQRLLAVKGETLAAYGAVSRQTAGEMVKGLLQLSGADLALSTTGIAGPGGGGGEKPVGLVYLACGGRGRDILVQERRFDGDRERVRRQTVHAAQKMLAAYMEDMR